MKAILIAVVLGFGCAGSLSAQNGAAPPKPAPQPATNANPFPDDTTNVPVMPSNPAALQAPPPQEEQNQPSAAVHVRAIDTDPVRSPDDEAIPDTEATGESSSSENLERMLGHAGDSSAPEEKKHRHGSQAQPKQKTQKDAAAEEIEVASFYLDKKNWRAAQSRYQSAMVLDPENPEVYWGLAESAYHLGDLYTARGYYLKVLDYDPDGPHGKALKKILKDSALLNAKPLPAQ